MSNFRLHTILFDCQKSIEQRTCWYWRNTFTVRSSWNIPVKDPDIIAPYHHCNIILYQLSSLHLISKLPVQVEILANFLEYFFEQSNFLEQACHDNLNMNYIYLYSAKDQWKYIFTWLKYLITIIGFVKTSKNNFSISQQYLKNWVQHYKTTLEIE